MLPEGRGIRQRAAVELQPIQQGEDGMYLPDPLLVLEVELGEGDVEGGRELRRGGGVLEEVEDGSDARKRKIESLEEVILLHGKLLENLNKDGEGSVLEGSVQDFLIERSTVAMQVLE